ncbi:hypothetical protein NQZ68_008095 [Dissostichus eleginoides]|nr:hypothetical protein NQZ68_008092 [Dissostichus eleginoides]KAI9529856.1 hypothetical protein NQZ68_008095 [Dissostichus eleginoides]
MRELCCYLLIPELPLEHRSGSVSRSAPCTGTVQPADRKARLASHKEANIEEHFLSQRGGPEKEMSMFGLAPALRVLLSLRQWDVDVEVGLGQMRKRR